MIETHAERTALDLLFLEYYALVEYIDNLLFFGRCIFFK